MNRLLAVFFLLLLVSSAAFGQSPLSNCNSVAVSPLTIRAQGDAEPTSDVLVSCTSVPSTFTPPTFFIDVVLTFNAPVASKVVQLSEGTGLEAVALVNATTSDLSNVPRITGSLTAPNQITFFGVPFNAIAPETVRFTNLRVRASAASGPQVTVAFTLFNDGVNIGSFTQRTVATIQPGLNFDVRTCNDSGPANNPTFPPRPPLNTAVLTGGTGNINFNVRFAEPFAFNFRRRIDPTQDPSVPGTLYNSESIFVNTTFLPAAAGQADQGTRLMAAFRNVPTGVRLFVTTRPVAGASSSTVNASLISTDAAGAGALAAVASTANATCPLNAAAGAFAVAEIPITSGTARAVWEITGSSANAVEQASFGVVVVFNTPEPNTGTAQVNGVLAPLATPNLRLNTPEFESVDQTRTAFTIALPTPPVITTTDPIPNGTQNVPYTFQFTGTTVSPPLVWSIGPNNLPFSAQINPATGVFTATPIAPGTYTLTINLFDAFFTTTPTQKTFRWTVDPPARPVIVTTAMPPGRVGVPYTLQFQGAGGTQPFTWSLGPNNLPFAASINPTTGVFTATPTTATTFTVTINLSDPNNANNPTQRTYQWTVEPPLRPVIDTAAMPPGKVGVPYTLQFQGSGGTQPFTWSLGPNDLPFAASINPVTGVFTATPTDFKTSFSVTINLSDPNNTNTPTQKTFQWQVDPGDLRITTTALPDAFITQQYNAQVLATGGSGGNVFTCEGTLPLGLTCGSNGVISGLPTQEESRTFTVRVTDRLGVTAISQPLTIRVVRPNLTVVIGTRALANGTVGQPYRQLVTASGGAQPFTWTAPGLPRGLSIDRTGLISGTPLEGGTFQVNLIVRDVFDNGDNVLLPLTITGGALTLVTDALPPGTVNTVYPNLTLSASGGTPPYTFTVTGLPNGLTATNGVIAGTPTAAGTSNVTIVLTDAATGNVTRTLPLVINPGPPQITTQTLPPGIVGAPYSPTVEATGGTQPFTWSLVGAPAGFSINQQTGQITGSFANTNSVPLTVRVTDAQGLTATQQFTITVTNPTPIQITTGQALGNLFVGDAMNFTIGVTGGAPPFQFALTGGAVPAGTTFNAANGSITGPIGAAAVGPVSFTITVTDAANQTASRTFTGQVLAPVSIPAQTLTATVGTVFNGRINVTGGVAPYNIVIAGGAPAGLGFDAATGQFSGSPNAAGTFNLAVTATDAANRTAQATIPLTINLPPASGVNVGGIPQTPPAGGQVQNITVTLGSPYPVPLTGTMTLTFTPNAAVAGDDPRVLFTNGRRTATFNVPANQTAGTFTDANLGIQLGTVAGTITLTPTLQANGVNVPCNCTPQAIVIARTAPVIRTVVARRSAGGFTVDVTGFSPSRELVSATFRFAQGTAGNLQTTEVTLQLGAAFATYFQSAEGLANGSEFTLSVPFTISGDPNAVSTVTVVLTNSVGSTTSSATTIQ
jgi:hypothetical protein